MTAILLILLAYAATTYLGLAAMFGWWRADFDEYGDAPAFMAFLPIVGPIAIVATCLFSRAWPDFDWPWRLARNGRRVGRGVATINPAKPIVGPMTPVLGPAFEGKTVPAAEAPDTMGWRCWVWDMTARELRSPSQRTLWATPELRCADWCESDVVRGVAGIHAARVPVGWQKLHIPESGGKVAAYMDGSHAYIIIHGVVERFGRFVLGTDGWRAEWVIIRQLHAPTTEIGLQLEAAFPEIEVTYDDR